MPKQSTLVVNESLGELQDLLKKYKKENKNFVRIQSLIAIKTKQFAKRKDLAKSLGYTVRSMELWLKVYREEGINAMVATKKERKPRQRVVTSEMHDAIKAKIEDPEGGFLSYVQAHQWLNSEFKDNEVSYQALRNYMRDIFGSKIKRPRKSHVKKDIKAQEAFLKTP